MEPKDHKQEICHINNALRRCGHPDWSFKEVRKRMDSRNTKQQKEENKRKKQKEDNGGQDKIMVTIPYVRGVSEAVERHSGDMG